MQLGFGREDDHASRRCFLAPRVMGLLKNENRSIGIFPTEHTLLLECFPRLQVMLQLLGDCSLGWWTSVHLTV